MTTPGILRRRKRPVRRPAPRPRIIDVTNTWRVDGPLVLRRVIVRELDGSLTERHLPDSHPAVVRHLEARQAVSA